MLVAEESKNFNRRGSFFLSRKTTGKRTEWKKKKKIINIIIQFQCHGVVQIILRFMGYLEILIRAGIRGKRSVTNTVWAVGGGATVSAERAEREVQNSSINHSRELYYIICYSHFELPPRPSSSLSSSCQTMLSCA